MSLLLNPKRALLVLYFFLCATKLQYHFVLQYSLGTIPVEHLAFWGISILTCFLFSLYRLVSQDSIPIDHLPLLQVAWHTLFASLSLLGFFAKVNPLNTLYDATLFPLSAFPYLIYLLIIERRSEILQNRIRPDVPFLPEFYRLGFHFVLSSAPCFGYLRLSYFLDEHLIWNDTTLRNTAVGVALFFVLLLLAGLYFNFKCTYGPLMEVYRCPKADASLELLLSNGVGPFLVLDVAFQDLPCARMALVTAYFCPIFCASAWKLAHCIEVSLRPSHLPQPLFEDQRLEEVEERNSDGEDSNMEDFSSDDEEMEEDPLLAQKLTEQRLKLKEALLKYKVSPTEDVRQCQVCTICLDSLVPSHVNVKLPACGHVFHFECLTPWALKRDSCPSCRGPLFQ